MVLNPGWTPYRGVAGGGQPNELVTVNGVVKPLPDAATLQTKWKVTRAAAALSKRKRSICCADGITIRNPISKVNRLHLFVSVAGDTYLRMRPMN